jgi:iron complex outermembrane receptor protein
MKKRLCVFTVIASAIISVGFASSAVADPEEKDIVETGEVIVTANRYEENTSSVPASITVITEKDIENTAAQDIPDMLRTVAGIHVNDITGNRRNYTVDLRGFGETAGSNTLVLVDGRRVNQADLSGTDWSLIPIDRVSRIEIIKGGRASTLYGDNAAGGVINIITKKGDDFKMGGKAAAGSYESYKTSAYLSGSKNNFSYALTGNYYDSDGYRDNSETEAKDFGLDLGYRLGEIGALNLSGGWHKDSTSLPGGLKTSDFNNGYSRKDDKNPDDYADTEDYYIKLTPEFYFLSDSMFKVDMSYRRRDVSSFASYGISGWSDADNEIKTVAINPQFVIHENIFERQNTLTLGYDYSKAEKDIDNFSYSAPPYEEFSSKERADLDKENYGFYVHNELMILEDLGLSAGYRYDRVKYDLDTSDPNKDTLKKTFDEDLFTAGINYRLSSKSNVYAAFSKSFRYPVLDEMFDYKYNLVYGLSPQTSNDFEIGIRHFITDTLRLSMSLFKIDTEDEILFDPNLDVPGEFFPGGNTNLDGDTEREGVEISLINTYKWGTASISYTYTRAKIDGGAYNNSNFPGVPRHQASATTVIDLWKPFTLSINTNYIGKRPFISDFNDNFKDQEDYVVVNTKLQYKWKKLTAFLDINNLLDKEYDEYGVLAIYSVPRERGYYPSPGINFMAGVTLDF